MNTEEKKEVEVAIGKEHPKSEVEEIELLKPAAMQLPIERLIPYPLLQAQSVNGKEACVLCEYVLHYIQNVVTDPTNEVIDYDMLILILRIDGNRIKY